MQRMLAFREILTAISLFFFFGSYVEARKLQKHPWAFIFFVAWTVTQIIIRTLILVNLTGWVDVLLTVSVSFQVLGSYFLYRIMKTEL